MNILFIGGTGFFGKAFINYFKTNNILDDNQITIVGRSIDSFLADNPEFGQLKNVKYVLELPKKYLYKNLLLKC